MLLDVDGLTKRRETFCLDQVSIQVDAGEAVGLLGTNGAGKTTLIKCIMGLTQPDAGQVTLFGQPVRGDVPADMKQDIGVVLDSCTFPGEYTLQEIGMLMRASWVNWDQQAFQGYLDRFSLDEKKKTKELSRGMGMKISLACALAHKPKLLFLDEATAGLDPLARDEVLGLLRAYLDETGAGMLLATHITTDLEHIADRVVCLDNGRMAFSVNRDAITDMAGLVRGTAEDAKALGECGLFAKEDLRLETCAYSVNVLVPDRYALMKAFPELVCDRVSVEDYMRLTIKGERL